MFAHLTQNWILKLISLAFAVVLWFFVTGERKQEVSYIVPLEYRGLADNMIIANEVPSSVSVRISGPRAVLMHHSAGDVSIAVDLKDLPAGITSFKRLEESLNLPSGLKVTRISPSYVDVKLERIREKEVPVRLVLTGEPMAGFRVIKTTLVPDRVIVAGAGSELKAVTEVSTEPIDLTGIQESFSQTAPIDFTGTYTYLKDQKTVEVEVLLGPDPDYKVPEPAPVETQGKMTKQLFGTDGVRGVANVHPMTTEIAMQIGRAVAYLFKHKDKRSRIVIGKDTRLSGYMIENALSAGICSMGVDVLLVGPLPTPGIAFITSSMRADAGVVISASHNPYQDNGIKFFGRDGFKLPDEKELQIEDLIMSGRIDDLRPTAAQVGKAFRVDDAVGRYVVFLKNAFPRNLDLTGLKIVLDCAHGAAYRVAPAVLEELGAQVVPYGIKPDGTNINFKCGSMHPELIAGAVREHGAHLGIALDGDADRCLFVDENGRNVDGDHILAICGIHLLNQGKLPHKTVVATVMSNMGLDIAMRNAGGRVTKTAVGDRYVVEEMRRQGCLLGGEQSGHMIFLEYNTTGDGVLTALQVLAIMQKSGKPLSELARVMTSLPQTLVNVRVRERKNINDIEAIRKVIDDVEQRLGDSGRVLVRYSGTEPLLRVMIEGQDQTEISEMASEIANAVQDHLGE